MIVPLSLPLGLTISCILCWLGQRLSWLPEKRVPRVIVAGTEALSRLIFDNKKR